MAASSVITRNIEFMGSSVTAMVWLCPMVAMPEMNGASAGADSVWIGRPLPRTRSPCKVTTITEISIRIMWSLPSFRRIPSSHCSRLMTQVVACRRAGSINTPRHHGWDYKFIIKMPIVAILFT